MNDVELVKLILAGMGYLKQTTAGYKDHKTDWYTNTTTMWYKGLALIDQVLAELTSRLNVVIVLSGGTTKLVATIKVG